MPVTKYIYDGDAVLQETDGAGVTQKTYTRTGPRYGDLLSEFDGTSTKYYEPDGLGSTAGQTHLILEEVADDCFEEGVVIAGLPSLVLDAHLRWGLLQHRQRHLSDQRQVLRPIALA